MLKSLLTLVAFFAIAAQAQTYDYAKKIGIGAGYGFEIPTFKTGTDTGDKSGETYNLHARYGLSSAGGLTLSWTRTDLAKTKTNADSWEVGYIHRLRPTARLTPTVGGSLGFTNYPNLSSRNTAWEPTLGLRGGVEYSICHNLVASVDVNVKYVSDAIQDRDDFDGHLVAVVPQANLTWFFGCGENCGQKEEMKSAPVAATPKAVDADSDNDGITNSKDKCPASKAGATVNAYGCEASEKAQIEVEVLFATSSSVITSESYGKLEEFATFLKEHPKTKAEIQGHTDSSGNPAKNKILSQGRANAVKAYLTSKLGIAADRLTAVGYGADKPVADNATADGRTENRRVMAIIEE